MYLTITAVLCKFIYHYVNTDLNNRISSFCMFRMMDEPRGRRTIATTSEHQNQRRLLVHSERRWLSACIRARTGRTGCCAHCTYFPRMMSWSEIFVFDGWLSLVLRYVAYCLLYLHDGRFLLLLQAWRQTFRIRSEIRAARKRAHRRFFIFSSFGTCCSTVSSSGSLCLPLSKMPLLATLKNGSLGHVANVGIATDTSVAAVSSISSSDSESEVESELLEDDEYRRFFHRLLVRQLLLNCLVLGVAMSPVQQNAAISNAKQRQLGPRRQSRRSNWYLCTRSVFLLESDNSTASTDGAVIPFFSGTSSLSGSNASCRAAADPLLHELFFPRAMHVVGE